MKIEIIFSFSFADIQQYQQKKTKDTHTTQHMQNQQPITSSADEPMTTHVDWTQQQMITEVITNGTTSYTLTYYVWTKEFIDSVITEEKVKSAIDTILFDVTIGMNKYEIYFDASHKREFQQNHYNSDCNAYNYDQELGLNQYLTNAVPQLTQELRMLYMEEKDNVDTDMLYMVFEKYLPVLQCVWKYGPRFHDVMYKNELVG